jgi:hypothetical protein
VISFNPWTYLESKASVERELMRVWTRVVISSQLSSTLMQLLFSFDRGMRVEKTLMQTLASQLSCNSCSRLTEVWELRKLWCKLSLLNSRATLVLVWPRQESWENSHANSRFPHELTHAKILTPKLVRLHETKRWNKICHLHQLLYKIYRSRHP